MQEDSLVTARMIRQTIQTSGDVEDMFDAVTYEKGATLIGMFEAYLGAPAFQRAIHATCWPMPAATPPPRTSSRPSTG
jgi:alanyl aminopeptidase